MRVGKEKSVVVPPMSSRYQTWKFQVSPVCTAVLVGRVGIFVRSTSWSTRPLPSAKDKEPAKLWGERLETSRRSLGMAGSNQTASRADALDLPAHLKNRQALRDNPYSVQASEVAGG